mgnify:CR=1 FL=1
MPEHALVLSEKDARGVVRLTLNRPAAFNSLSEGMLEALQVALDRVAGDETARAVVIAAVGKAFCAGHDLKEMRANHDKAFMQDLFGRCAKMMMTLTRMPQPVIARVHGIATAAGCQLVSMCDLAVAADTARFATSGINVGLFCATPGVGLSRNLGRKQALEMLLTGDFIDAWTAQRQGLVNRVVPDGDLVAEVDERRRGEQRLLSLEELGRFHQVERLFPRRVAFLAADQQQLPTPLKGRVQAAPQDLARLLLVKFALEYSNDWFLLPLELPVGTVSQVRALVLTNTFGERFLIPHASEVDGPASPWRMFSLTNDTQKLFFLPPVLGPLLESQPVEDLSLLRDEMANMAWAVERVVESAAGRPLDRHEAYQETLAAQPPPPSAGSEGDPLVYRLGTTVPDYWIPLLPVKDGTTLRLKRGALPAFGEGGIQGAQRPKGRLLEPNRELLLFDEEVPREGARVTRTYQYARWIDGSTHLWLGRRKGPDRGEGSSGLQFDVAEKREEGNS